MTTTLIKVIDAHSVPVDTGEETRQVLFEDKFHIVAEQINELIASERERAFAAGACSVESDSLVNTDAL